MTVLRSVEELGGALRPPEGRLPSSRRFAFLNAHYRAFIEASPFVVLASAGPGGLDCSPKGDAPGFVRVLDEKHARHSRQARQQPHRHAAQPRGRSAPRASVSRAFAQRDLARQRTRGDLDRRRAPRLLRGRRQGAAQRHPRRQSSAAYVHCAKAFMRSKLWERRREARAPRSAEHGRDDGIAQPEQRRRGRLRSRGARAAQG